MEARLLSASRLYLWKAGLLLERHTADGLEATSRSSMYCCYAVKKFGELGTNGATQVPGDVLAV